MTKKNTAKQNSSLELFSNFVVFQTEKGKVNIDVFFQNDTLWLTQKKIADELLEKQGYQYIYAPSIAPDVDHVSLHPGETEERVIQ